jgi:uncharacterized phiE125 gp8 family phage protein
MNLKTITPGNEVLTRNIVKNYIKLEENVILEDTLIDSLITTARNLSEEYMDRALSSRSMQVIINTDDLSDNLFALPLAPQSEVTQVVEIDLEGNETTLTLNTDYYIKGINELTFIRNKTISTGYSEDYIYKINYTCGYGIATGAENIQTPTMPEAIKLAMLKQIEMWYDARGSEMMVLSNDVRRILDAYKYYSSF